jgi:hypothetical protein
MRMIHVLRKIEKQGMEGTIVQCEYCIRRDTLFIPAWEGMAVACHKMGKRREAGRCEKMIAHIRKHLWENEREE